MPMTPHFVCFRWGTLYPAIYVERLYRSVCQRFPEPFEFHCFTDRPLALPEAVHQHELVLGQPFSGNWNKERVFSRGFLDLEPGTPIIVMDLDVLVTGDLGFLVTDLPDKPLVMAPDGYKRRQGKGHGSVFRVQAGAFPEVWEDLLAADYESMTRELGGEREQKWLDRYFPAGKVVLYPAGRVVSYKYHCGSMGAKPFGKRAAYWGLTSAVWGRAQVPDGARVVCFHGKPDMEDVADGRWGWWRWAPFVREFWLV